MALVFKKPKEVEELEKKEESTEESKEVNHYDELIGLLFHARTQLHYFHLQTKVEAEHTTLGGFYGSLLELTDEFAELYMGMGNEVVSAPCKDFVDYKGIDQVRDYLKELLEEIKECTCDSPELELVLLEVNQLIYKTLFLLQLK